MIREETDRYEIPVRVFFLSVCPEYQSTRSDIR